MFKQIPPVRFYPNEYQSAGTKKKSLEVVFHLHASIIKHKIFQTLSVSSDTVHLSRPLILFILLTCST